MAVHYSPENNPKHRNRTIRHDRPYCHCPDGDRCETSDYKTPPKKDKKPKNNLASRIKGFEAMRSHSGLKRPGSQKK